MKPDLAEIHGRFPAAAEYLSGIYILRRDYGEAGNTKLSEWVGVSGSAVTQALSRLKRLGLARQERYGDIALTPGGRQLAIQVLRRHYLLEHLLVRVLGYPWEKADLEAKLLQNLISADLTEHLYRRLGSPQTCPHGNPMPGARVEKKLLAAARLSEAPAGRRITILRITEEGEQVPSLLSTCGTRGVTPGAAFRTDGRDERTVWLTAGRGSRRVGIPLAMAWHVRWEPSKRRAAPARPARSRNS
jgi:DtxR family transcriptional regulator, Mn-dependent transcriptional regulator